MNISKIGRDCDMWEMQFLNICFQFVWEYLSEYYFGSFEGVYVGCRSKKNIEYVILLSYYYNAYQIVAMKFALGKLVQKGRSLFSLQNTSFICQIHSFFF
eukprot:TRINITY_DN46034_c0_g2_i1.p10 TRINITY_DN46034_c0_g2~~TRINITY_DN46034_c0_g2_i1.p10  ORF type:complete len:100 (-),score=3.21 TRINITY_DN46034_c0_g2_i1:1268-1567(-)